MENKKERHLIDKKYMKEVHLWQVAKTKAESNKVQEEEINEHRLDKKSTLNAEKKKIWKDHT